MTSTSTSTRWVIRVEREGTTWWIHALQPLTSPSWTDNPRDAATYASKAYATRKAAQYRLGDVEVVAVRAPRH